MLLRGLHEPRLVRRLIRTREEGANSTARIRVAAVRERLISIERHRISRLLCRARGDAARQQWKATHTGIHHRPLPPSLVTSGAGYRFIKFYRGACSYFGETGFQNRGRESAYNKPPPIVSVVRNCRRARLSAIQSVRYRRTWKRSVSHVINRAPQPRAAPSWRARVRVRSAIFELIKSTVIIHRRYNQNIIIPRTSGRKSYPVEGEKYRRSITENEVNQTRNRTRMIVRLNEETFRVDIVSISFHAPAYPTSLYNYNSYGYSYTRTRTCRISDITLYE